MSSGSARRGGPRGRGACSPLLLLALTLALAPTTAHAAAPEATPDVERSPVARLELRADLQNLFHFRNDADFDRSAPTYDESGQTVGAFATILTPSLTFNVTESLRLFYQLELGLNYWSKQNPDQQDPLASDIFVLKHRELYAAGELLEGRLGFLVGYAHVTDPTGLFVNHWMGVARAWWSWSSGSRAGVFVGQIPDQTYEGIDVTQNNFKRDIWLFGADGRLQLSERLHLAAALTSLLDTHLPDQTRWLVGPSARLALTGERWTWSLDAALQAGQQLGLALDGGDQTVVAWAAQGRAELALGAWTLRGTLLALSPDDAHEGNAYSHAFTYSGKNLSSTLQLTEDETRDWYDNLDERMSRFSGGFFEGRAGLLVADLKTSWAAHPRLTPALIVGAATVLKPENALDGVFVGLEADLVLAVQIADYLQGQVVVGGFFPGAAGGALINRISRDATDPVLMTELSLLLRY